LAAVVPPPPASDDFASVTVSDDLFSFEVAVAVVVVAGGLFALAVPLLLPGGATPREEETRRPHLDADGNAGFLTTGVGGTLSEDGRGRGVITVSSLEVAIVTLGPHKLYSLFCKI